MAQLDNTEFSDPGFLQLPRGNTSQRPATPQIGDARFNTDIDEFEYYDGSLWKRATGGSVIATGGTISQLGPYTRHVFTSTGNSTFAVTSAGYVDVLIVGGGGEACPEALDDGGGGGGGIVYRNRVLVTPQNYTITVGAGGSGGSSGNPGNNGGNSSAFGFTALGGGGGASINQNNARDGGSGGGSSEDIANATGGNALQPTATDIGYGHKGGDQPSRTNNHGGGGGGAGEPGENAFLVTGHSSGSKTYDPAVDAVGNGGIGWYFGGIFGADAKGLAVSAAAEMVLLVQLLLVQVCPTPVEEEAAELTMHQTQAAQTQAAVMAAAVL